MHAWAVKTGYEVVAIDPTHLVCEFLELPGMERGVRELKARLLGHNSLIFLYKSNV